LSIYSIHLFKHLESLSARDIEQLYFSACATINAILELDQDAQLGFYGTAYMWMGMLLAIGVLLRVLKTPLADLISHDDGERIFLAGLGNLKSWSVAHDDQTSRITDAITKQWRSDRIFKYPDGSYNIALRIRSRLSMSIMYDTFWWFREEFGGQPNAYSQSNRTGQFSPSPGFNSCITFNSLT
jgi:transcriptional regulatory protein LEU3